MTEADEERLELRLLTDPSFSEEFDTIVDELTDQYAGNELQGEERSRVEQYFLRAPERQNKVRFACELLRRAEVERGGNVLDVSVPSLVQRDPGLWERARSFWNDQAFSLRFATMTATVVIVFGLGLLLLSTRNPSSQRYASLALQISNSERSAGSEVKSVRPQPGDSGIRIELALPERGQQQGQRYRVNLTGEQVSRDVPIAEQNAQKVVILMPTNELPRGSYVIQLYAMNADGTEERIRGSYFFNVE